MSGAPQEDVLEAIYPAVKVRFGSRFTGGEAAAARQKNAPTTDMDAIDGVGPFCARSRRSINGIHLDRSWREPARRLSRSRSAAGF